jgi:cobalt-zinc-cadmium efflux system membrane fusion protein
MAVGLSGCHGKHGHSHEKGHDHAHEHEPAGDNHAHAHGSPEHGDEIAFTREQAEAAGLTTERVAPGTFHGVIKASGHLQTVQGDQTTLAATASGIVSFVNPSVSEGMAVKSGESIVTISSKHLQDGDPATKAWG